YVNTARALSRPTLTSSVCGPAKVTEFGDAPTVDPGSGSTLKVCVTLCEAASMTDTVSLLVLATNTEPPSTVSDAGCGPTLIVPVTVSVSRLTTETVPVADAPVTGLETIGVPSELFVVSPGTAFRPPRLDTNASLPTMATSCGALPTGILFT